MYNVQQNIKRLMFNFRRYELLTATILGAGAVAAVGLAGAVNKAYVSASEQLGSIEVASNSLEILLISGATALVLFTAGRAADYLANPREKGLVDMSLERNLQASNY